MRTTEARVFWTPENEEGRFLPEGPRRVRDADRPAVMWINIQTATTAKSGSLHFRYLDTPGLFERLEHRSESLPGRPGFALPTDNPEAVLIGADKSVGLLIRGVWHTLATIPDADPRTIINDAEVVPGGKAVVFGTKDTQFKDPIAHLYLYTVDDNRVSVLADGQVCSNGKVFRTDDRGLILFDIDTPKRNVVRYRLDVAARTATPDGVALDLADQPGFPDGMCDCGDGTVVVAFYNPDPVGAGRAVRFDLATGEAVEEWTTPGSPRVTCPLLVERPDWFRRAGHDTTNGVKLVLTTATEGMPAEMRAGCPNAGCLFIADTTLEGCPEPESVRLP